MFLISGMVSIVFVIWRFKFIEFKENEDIFVHYSAIEIDGYKTLSEGQLVEFKLVETSKGYQAINVKLVKETATEK